MELCGNGYASSDEDRSIVSVIAPVFCNAETLTELVERMVAALESTGKQFELILVDDGSRDRSWSVISDLARRESRLKGILLSRNFGQHAALAAGFQHAAGTSIVILDADLEDPPESIPPLLAELDDPEVDIVFTQKLGEQGTWLTRLTSRFYHGLFAYLTGTNVPKRIGTMRAFRRRVLESLLQFGERRVLYGPLMFYIGYSWRIVPHQRDPRSGRSGYTFARRLRLAADSIISHTDLPYRVLLAGGGIMSLGSTLYLVAVFVQRVVFGQQLPSGISLLVAINCLILGCCSGCSGILGMYTFRAFQELLDRPRYLIRQTANIAVERWDSRFDTRRLVELGEAILRQATQTPAPTCDRGDSFSAVELR
jgi:dolichol-phosphate mannosyltransferase